MKRHSSKKRSKTNWEKIDAMSDKDIDYSDIPALGKAFFKHATLVLPEAKTTVTMRVDRKVLD